MYCKNVLTEKVSEMSASLRIDDHTKVHFVTGHDNGNICFWNLDTGLICRLPIHSNTTCSLIPANFENDTDYLVDSPGKNINNKYYVVSGSFDGSLALIEFQRVYRKPQYIVVEKAHSCEILCLAQNKMDGTILTGANDGKIKVWSKELQIVGAMSGHKKGVTCMVLDSYFLFSGGDDHRIVMWNMLTRMKLKEFNFHSAYISCLKFVPETGSMLSCSRDGVLIMWDYTASTVEFVCLLMFV
jgi:WD40 repeat protein